MSSNTPRRVTSDRRLPGLRRHTAASGRGRDRDPGLCPWHLPCHPPCAPEAILPELRDNYPGPCPSLPIRRGRAGAGLLAHVLVAKYCDHLPLHRQAEIYAREDVDLSRSTLADMVGQTARLVRPLIDALARHVMSGERVHADDTVVPVLEPGLGRTGRRGCGPMCVTIGPSAGTDPPAVLYRYSPDRKGEHPRAHLRDFRGILQADGYAGYAGLYGNRIVEAACMAHARRKFFDVHETTKSPLAREALDRIAALYGSRRRSAAVHPSSAYASGLSRLRR